MSHTPQYGAPFGGTGGPGGPGRPGGPGPGGPAPGPGQPGRPGLAPAQQQAFAPGQQPGNPAGMRGPIGPQFVDPLPPKRDTVMNVVTIIVMAIAVVLTLGVLALAMLSSGPVLVVVSLMLALLTAAFVWFVVWFIDRWEPEPKILLFGALLWGAGIATTGSLIYGAIASLVVPDAPEWMGAVIQAPIVEEIAKGLGVFIIFLVARRHIHGPTDGIVLGALSGAGFAFTENILYFSSVAASGFETSAGVVIVSLGFQYLIRGIALPLLHPICASLTGAGIGFGARRGGVGAALAGGAIGLVPAMLIHFAWNGGSTLNGVLAQDTGQVLLGTLALFVVVMVPIFIGWIVFVVRLRKRDRTLLRERLGEYATVGWFSPAEVDMLTTMSGRSGARSWAARLGPRAKEAMKQFIEHSSRLAHTRHQVLLDPTNVAKQQHERQLLSDLTRIRGVLDQSQRSGMHHMAPAAPVAMPAQLPPRMPQPVYQAPPAQPPMRPEQRPMHPGRQPMHPGQQPMHPGQQPMHPGHGQQPSAGAPSPYGPPGGAPGRPQFGAPPSPGPR